MNNVEKGNSFELEIYEKLKDLLEQGEVAGVSKRHKIFWQKKYFSKTERREIIFDITIESYRTDEDFEKENYSTLHIFECKNYKSTVNRSKFDAFERNLQYMGYGVKGFMVTTSGFSKENIIEASNHNTGLIVVKPGMDWNWIVSRQINNIAKRQLDYEELLGYSQNSNHPIIYKNNEFLTIGDLLDDIGIKNKNSLIIPFINEEEIKEKALEITDVVYIDKTIKSMYNPNLQHDFLEKPIKYVRNLGYKLVYKYIDETTLGYCDMQNKIICVSDYIDKNRQRFTIAHEIGHIILHHELIDKISYFGDTDNTFNNFTINVNTSNVNRMEVQANKFASYILIPDDLFRLEVICLFTRFLRIHPKFDGLYLYVDDQKCNIEQYKTALRYLSAKFYVSQEAIKYRLIKDKYLVVDNSYKELYYY